MRKHRMSRFGIHRAFSLLCLLSACAQSPVQKPSVAALGRVAPEPPAQAYQTQDPNRITIAVVGINDFHGHVIPKERKLPDGRVIKSGGAPVLTSMLKILRDEMKGRMLIVDAGDEWQGTIESNQVKGSIVMDYYNRIGINSATFGNHEFDFGMDNLHERARLAKFPYLAANIYEKSTGKRVGPSNGWDNVYPSKILEIAGIKIGVIGVSTQETPGTTRYEVVKPFEFRNPVKVIEEQSAVLRKEGAGAVIVSSHAGSQCEPKENLRDWRIWRDGDDTGKCGQDEEMSRVYAKVKKGAVDAAILGHTHMIVHHWISGIPSIEDEAFNQYFNILYLTFERKTGKLIPSETRIEGLIPICDLFFENAYHCDARRLPDGLSPDTRSATFHGKTVVADVDVSKWLVPILESTEKFRRQILATTELTLFHDTTRESAFGNLVADILRERAGADIALVNAKGIRSTIDAGPISTDSLYRSLPFDNNLQTIRIKGKDVKLMFQIATSGPHGFASNSGLRMKLIPINEDAPKVDLNKDGKLEQWETNRIVEITMADGSPIDDNKIYTLATFDFILNGGDDMSWFMKRVPKQAIKLITPTYCREIVTDYLREKKVINTRAHPLIDPLKPRIVLVPIKG
ncbi:MAG: 5'-nucleotidase C-terminal domain-containing protein [Bdellovibrionales bacterium]|nr:5'-nucleotidase C-terminal domain-containing protein [Bdellovibrionales bacterium]